MARELFKNIKPEEFKYETDLDRIELMTDPNYVSGRRQFTLRRRKFTVYFEARWNGRFIDPDQTSNVVVNDARYRPVKEKTFYDQVRTETLRWASDQVAWWGNIWMFRRLIDVEERQKDLERQLDRMQESLRSAAGVLDQY